MTTPADAEDTHPGFTITCDGCGSDKVEVENTLGLSETGGSLDLTCKACGRYVELFHG